MTVNDKGGTEFNTDCQGSANFASFYLVSSPTQSRLMIVEQKPLGHKPNYRLLIILYDSYKECIKASKSRRV